MPDISTYVSNEKLLWAVVAALLAVLSILHTDARSDIRILREVKADKEMIMALEKRLECSDKKLDAIYEGLLHKGIIAPVTVR
jgi:hypothetical protein